MRRARQCLILPLLVSCVFSGCASVPRFDELHEIDQAPSLQEALLLCSDYDLTRHDQRPIGYKPYVECVDRAAKSHPPAPGSGFETFQREMHSGYSNLHEETWSRELAQELELATDTALRLLWEEPGRKRQIDARSFEVISRHFPKFARAIKLREWPVVRPAPLSPELEKLRAAVAALEERGTASDEACQALRALRLKVDYLGDLWRDAADLHSTTLGRTVLERYRLRVSEALKDLQKVRPEVEGNPLPESPQGLTQGCPAKTPRVGRDA